MIKPTAEVIKKTLRSEMGRLHTDNVVAVCNIEGKTERLFIREERDGNYYLTFGTYGDIDSTARLLERLNLVEIES